MRDPRFTQTGDLVGTLRVNADESITVLKFVLRGDPPECDAV